MLVVILLLAAQTPSDAASVKKEKPQESASAPPPQGSTTSAGFSQEAQGTAGALFNGGNVQGAAVKAGGFYSFRFDAHGVRADAGAGLVGLAVDQDADPSNGYTFVEKNGTTREATALDNLNTNGFAKLRYDFFLGDFGSIYAAGLGFHDSAANLLLRLRTDVGYRHFLFNVPKHSLSAEVGAVYTLDNAIFATENADTNGDGKVSVWGDDTEFEEGGGVVGARAAVAYTNALLDNVSFTQTVEVVPNLSFGEDVPVFGNVPAPFEQLRSPNGEGDQQLGLGEATLFTSSTTLTVNVLSNLSVSGNLTLLYDNGAVARRNAFTNHDVATSIQLAWKFF